MAIKIPIESTFDAKGTSAAIRALQELAAAKAKATGADGQLAAASAKVASAQATVAASSQRVAQAHNQTAVSAARVTAAQNQASISAQKLAQQQARTAAEVVKLEAAQSKAALAALRLDQAQTKAAQGGRSLSQTLGGLTQAAGAFGVALGAQQVLDFAKSTVDLANNTKQADSALRALAGSPTLYAEALAAARQQQVLFGGSLQENISGIQGLITVSRDSGLELSKLIDITQRLSVKDPSQGAAGARIALQEAFSGDPTSLKKRYEITGEVLATIRDESASANEKLAALDGYLNNIGITSEVASGSVTKSAQQINMLAASAERAQIALGTMIAPGVGAAAEDLATGIDRLMQGTDGLRAAWEQLVLGAAATTAAENARIAALQAGATSAEAAEAATWAYRDAIAASTGAFGEGASVSSTWGDAQFEAAAAADAANAAIGEMLAQTLADADAKTAADEKARMFAEAQQTIANLGGAVAAGLTTSAEGALILADRYGIAYNQALLLIDAQARIAGGAARLASQKANTRDLVPGGPGVNAPGRRGQSDADILATVAATEKELTAVGVRGQQVRTAAVRAGGGARVSAERDAAAQMREIAQETADKLAAIDERAAERRAEAAKSLAANIATTSADMVANQEANDLELVGASEEQRAALMAREEAEARARIAQADAVAEARRMAEAGDAEQAQAVLDAKTAAIQQQQQLDEDYAKRRAELAGDPAATEALKTQYDEATAALNDATNERIAIAALEAQAREEALARERQAVVDAAVAQVAAMGKTGESAAAAAGRVQSLVDALASIPTNVTTTITVNEQRSGSTSSASGGSGGSANKAGAGMVGVTSGPATLTVGDNPGGVEIVTVTPVSGVGTTSISSGNIHMAGGGTAIVGDAAQRAEDRLRNAPGIGNLPPAAAAPRSAGGAKRAAEQAAKEEKAAKPAIADYAKAARENLDLLAETLKIRQAVQDPATWAPLNDEVLESAARDADKVARTFADIATTYDTKVLESAKLYSDALGGSFSVIKDGLEVFDLLRGSEALDMTSLMRFQRDASAAIDMVSALGAQAATIPETSVTALGNIASTLSVLPSLGMLGGGGGTTTNVGGVTNYIYQQPGQDNQALIRQIMQAINAQAGSRR